MLISDLIRSVRLRINDADAVGFQEDELLDYVNMGIQWLYRLIARERPELLSKKEVVQQAPYQLSQKAIRILEGPADLVVKMNGLLETEQEAPFRVSYVPDMKDLKNSDEFPYFTVFRNFVVELAVIRAQARNEFDMSLEAELFSRMESQALEVIWGLKSERNEMEPYYGNPVMGDYGG